MSKEIVIAEQYNSEIKTLGIREQYRDRYWQKRDPIAEDRLLWRAQTFRHIVHLLPNQSILELGCGRGLFTRQLLRVSRGENPITAVTFNANNSRPDDLPSSVEFFNASYRNFWVKKIRGDCLVVPPFMSWSPKLALLEYLLFTMTLFMLH